MPPARKPDQSAPAAVSPIVAGVVYLFLYGNQGLLGPILQPLGLQIRAGLHTGEIERVGGDVSGVAVHLAARIMAAAEPGEVVVSRVVPDLVVGSGIEFADLGTAQLRGIPAPWQLCRVERVP